MKIDIEQMEHARWATLAGKCAGKIDSVIELLSGELSDSVMRVLCSPEQGLFPSSKQLELSCSCPDYAGLCKHLAAVLYGVGARLDSKPELFFILRGVDTMALVGEAALGSKADASDLKSEDLSNIFGIELDRSPSAALPAISLERTTRSSSGKRSKKGGVVGSAVDVPAPVSKPKRKPPAARAKRSAPVAIAKQGRKTREPFKTQHKALEKLRRKVRTPR